MNILYCFCKQGFEAEFWTREIAAASTERHRFVPFNYQSFLSPARYVRAQLLDNLYFDRDPELMSMYASFEAALARESIDAIIVDNCFPFHPEYLRRIQTYKVMRTSDGPISAYDRDIPYLHAYDHVLYHSPAYSPELTMPELLRSCGVEAMDFWPAGLFDAAWDNSRTDETILAHERDIDVIFIGSMHVGKMPFLAKIKRALGSSCRVHGQTSFKRNAYLVARHGYPGWIRPVPFPEYVPLYQRTKIGFNVHNRGKFTVGSYRLFELPANGVLQISDGGEYLDEFFAVGSEIVGYEHVDDLIEKIRYFLSHPDERERIARAGFRRAITQYRMRPHLASAADMIERRAKASGRRDLGTRSTPARRDPLASMADAD